LLTETRNEEREFTIVLRPSLKILYFMGNSGFWRRQGRT